MGRSKADAPPTETLMLLSDGGPGSGPGRGTGSGRCRRGVPHVWRRSGSAPYIRSHSCSGMFGRSTGMASNPTVAKGQAAPGASSLWATTTRTQWLILFTLFISNVFSFMCLALMAPFFPAEAEDKGMSPSVSGWVFGIFSLVQFGFAPVVGKLIPVVGSTFILLTGCFFGGGCTIIFGFLDRVPVTADSHMTFMVLCFTLRIFLALGCTACSTATFAIAINTFPANASTALGFLDTGIGVGLMSGPAIGGLLYEAGGFIAPFASVGGAMVVSSGLFWFTLSSQHDGEAGEEPAASTMDLLRVPVICLILVTIVVTALLWVALDPILEPNLRQYDLSPSQVGLAFLLLSGTYAVMAPIVGRISDKVADSTPLLGAGFALLTVALLLLGPSPLLGLQHYNQLWLVLLSLVLMGVGVALTVVPTYSKIFTSAQKAGIPETMANHCTVAGLWTSVYALGEFVGPIYSGAAYEAIGFNWTTTILAVSTLLMLLLTIFIYVYETRSSCRGSHISHLSSPDGDCV